MRVLSAILFLFLGACTYSNVSSYTDRSALTKGPFSHIVVMASNFPLGERQIVEDAVVSALVNSGMTATPGVEVSPPTRTIGRQEIERKVADLGADGLLVIYELGRETITNYVPPQVVAGGTSSTHGSIRGFNGIYTIDTNTTHSAPTISGGYTVRKPTAKYGAALYDLRQGGIRIWIAEISARGSGIASYADLADEVGKATFQRLREDGVL